MKLTFALTALLTLSAGIAAAQSTPTNARSVRKVTFGQGKWRVVDFRTGGMSMNTTTRPDPFGGAGSLEQVLPGPGDESFKTEVELMSRDVVLEPGRGLVPTRGGFGLLTDLHDLLVSWYRDGASTTWPWMGPAIRVFVYDPDLGVNGTSSIMIWEPVYAGYATGPTFAVPVDQWIQSRLDDQPFWRQPLYLDGQRVPRSFCSDNPSECHRYLRLRDWGFGPRTVIFGFSISAGSGWPGSYRGFVDYLSLELSGARTWTWNFEPTRGQIRRAQRAARRAARGR